MMTFMVRCIRQIGGGSAILLAAACSLSVPSPYTPEDAVSDDGPDTDGVDVPGHCPEGQTRCGDSCVDTSADPQHCGDCFNACTAGMACVESVCVCPEGLQDCGGVCVDVTSNPAHCGECANACSDGMVCNDGTCSNECGEGLTNCSGACVNLSSDPMNCGDCDFLCPSAVGAIAVCEAAACGLDCWPNRWDLDDVPGCEYECSYSSEEVCDGQDNDCNGVADDGFECTPGLGSTCTTACGTHGMRECDASTCTWRPCCAAAETCHNDCDDNCNGTVDEGCLEVPNDTCASPMDATAGGRFTGSTTPATDNSRGACSAAAAGRDVYFSFTLTDTSDVFVSSFGSMFDTVLYVGSTCGEDDIGCWDNYSTAVTQSYLRMEDLAPGTYFVALDGNGDAQHGDYVLDVYISPSGDVTDQCGNPGRLDTTGESGSTCGYGDNASGSCDNDFPMTVPDRVYFVVVPTSGTTRNVRFSTCNTDTNYDSLMHLRSVCSDPESEVACNDDAESSCPGSPTRSILQADLSPGVYYLFIEAFGNSWGECGDFTITTTGL